MIALLYPLVLFYFEAVFRLSLGQELWKPGTLFMLLFTVALGGIVWLLATVSKRKWVNSLITQIYLIVAALPFIIEYFIYRKFKVLYDLNTSLGGAKDAVGDFQEDIWAMVFSQDGMIRIILLLLPALLFAIFGWKFAAARKAHRKGRIVMVTAIVAAFAAGVVGVNRNERLRLITQEEYSFQSVVEELGLITGITLDAKQMIAPSGAQGNFEHNATIPVVTIPPTTEALEQTTGFDPDGHTTTPPETTPEITEPPVVYTPNVMDIDFATLEGRGYYAQLNEYVASLTPTMKNAYTGLFEGKNLIFITAEAFTAEVIDPELTPTLYRLANQGIQFLDYYQPSGSGTTGGEYQNVFGLLPTKSGMSFKTTADYCNYFTMGSQLDRLGYYGKAFHNHDYTYYDRHITHNNLGYSDGFMGFGNGLEKYITNQWPKSDLEMMQATVPMYIDKQPFNIYYMTVSGHSRYTRGSNSMTKKNWHRVEHLDCSDVVKGYLAANLELEDAMTYLVEQLELAGIADDTVIVIASDHFPYGLDDNTGDSKLQYLSELYGNKVKDNFYRDHNRLIIWSGCLEDMEPIVVDSPTSSLDILPTLSNLFGTEFDSRLMVGRDVFSDAPAIVFNSSGNWKTEYGTYLNGKFYPADDAMEIPEGYVAGVKAIVNNKIRYCTLLLKVDYFGYLFDE